VAFWVALIDCAGGRDRASSTQAVAGEIDAVGVVDEAVEDGVGIEMLWGERRGQGIIVAGNNRRGCPMPQPNDLSRSLAALDQDSTLIAVIEMSQSSWAGRRYRSGDQSPAVEETCSR
jgi:hypothetical protein